MLDEIRELRWDDVPILAIDTETTGLSSKDRICEVALVLLRGEEVVDSFSSLVDPGFSISEEASAVSGITDEMVASAPRWDEIETEVMDFLLRGAPWVAHNLRFDARMLGYEIGDNWPGGIATLCTKVLSSRRLGKSVVDHKLETLAEHFGIEQGQAHRAFDDALVCGRVARRLTQGLGIGSCAVSSERLKR
jgi:DNA polymerase-3 subunit epsilon